LIVHHKVHRYADTFGAMAFLRPLFTSSLLDFFKIDIAPYVRSIAAYDYELEQEKVRLALALTGGGKRKARLTRTSRNVMEGGRREYMRRDRWFSNVNLEEIKETGSKEWTQKRHGTESISISMDFVVDNQSP